MNRGIDAITRLRRLALDEAKRDLALSLRVLDKAASAEHAAACAVQAERAAASDPAAPDAAVEAFAAWLPGGLASVETTRAMTVRAEAGTAQARAGVAVARAAVEAAEIIRAARADALALNTARAAQADLDEAAGNMRR